MIAFRVVIGAAIDMNDLEIPDHKSEITKIAKSGIIYKKRIIMGGEHEAKGRAWDIGYMKKFFPSTRSVEMQGVSHGALAIFHPERFAAVMMRTLNGSPLTG